MSHPDWKAAVINVVEIRQSNLETAVRLIDTVLDTYFERDVHASDRDATAADVANHYASIQAQLCAASELLFQYATELDAAQNCDTVPVQLAWAYHKSVYNLTELPSTET